MMQVLSPRDLARALGVSESSLKRWIDAGRIKAARTEGGHRRVHLADALAFIRVSGMVVEHPEVLGLARTGVGAPVPPPTPDGDAETALYDALVNGEWRATHGWMSEAIEGGASIAALCDGPLRLAMYAIGDLWRHDPDGVYLEHRATATCMRALSNLDVGLPTPKDNAPLALGGAPEADPYQLPTLMASLVLAAEGVRTIDLGAHTPTAALHRAVDRMNPALVWISASAPLEPAQAHDLAAFASAVPQSLVVVGGRQSEVIAAADPRLRVGNSMMELAAMGRALVSMSA